MNKNVYVHRMWKKTRWRLMSQILDVYLSAVNKDLKIMLDVIAYL